MMPQRASEPAGIAIGLLLVGGGALLLDSLFGVWVAFSIVAVLAGAAAGGATVQRRRAVRLEHEQREWRRILWEEWRYREE
ncbi:hypothetical protein [Streptomyces sp. NPDC019890]|uniref:hypothetical protein n=1 Tax=Streptomyces sp. NPDC019890 TaxID=3365064 RepID=UPI00384F7B1D